ncbi:hypothetical protein GCM10022399_35490 [Terrabacter ginsenosidimutans]|uniref:DUF6318 domain-containing protein n=1 Tax=Terrabacter ginsenosidimutans TaxID=490575 RepID=A0ABP7EBM9_9MICO
MTAAARPHPHRRLLPYAAAGLAVALLGACTAGDPGPTTTTPPSSTTTSAAPSTTTTSAPSPTTSVNQAIVKIPGPARAKSMAGAEAFARFYVQQINVAFTEPDPHVFDGIYSDDCDVCVTYRNTAEDFERKGRKQEQDLLHITSATASKFASGKATVNVFFDQRAVAVIDRSGSTVSKTSSGKGALVFSLSHDGKLWKVNSLKAAAA